MDFREQVIPIWMICYDGDADRVYTFTNFDKAAASVECSIRGYYGESDDIDDACEKVSKRMYELKEAPCVPMKFHNLQVVVYRWEIDASNPLHKTLSKCYEEVGDDLRPNIENLFAESVL